MIKYRNSLVLTMKGELSTVIENAVFGTTLSAPLTRQHFWFSARQNYFDAFAQIFQLSKWCITITLIPLSIYLSKTKRNLFKGKSIYYIHPLFFIWNHTVVVLFKSNLSMLFSRLHFAISSSTSLALHCGTRSLSCGCPSGWQEG